MPPPRPLPPPPIPKQMLYSLKSSHILPAKVNLCAPSISCTAYKMACVNLSPPFVTMVCTASTLCTLLQATN